MQNSIEHYLKVAESTGKFLTHAQLLIKLSRLYQKMVPIPLAKASRLVNYTSGTIVIYADNNAVATKLRQLVSTISNNFSIKGYECTDVKIKVQPLDLYRQPVRLPSSKPLSKVAASKIHHLAETLQPSPLRNALQGLLERSARAE